MCTKLFIFSYFVFEVLLIWLSGLLLFCILQLSRWWPIYEDIWDLLFPDIVNSSWLSHSERSSLGLTWLKLINFPAKLPEWYLSEALTVNQFHSDFREPARWMVSTSQPIRSLQEGGPNLLIILSGVDSQCAGAARVTKMVLIKE